MRRATRSASPRPASPPPVSTSPASTRPPRPVAAVIALTALTALAAVPGCVRPPPAASQATINSAEPTYLRQLRRLYRENPLDREVVLNLSTALAAQAPPPTPPGTSPEAEAVIEGYLAGLLAHASPSVEPAPPLRNPISSLPSARSDVELLRRLVRLKLARNDLRDAARTLILATARDPDALEAFASMLEQFCDQVRTDLLPPDDLLTLDVGADPAVLEARRLLHARLTFFKGNSLRAWSTVFRAQPVSSAGIVMVASWRVDGLTKPLTPAGLDRYEFLAQTARTRFGKRTELTIRGYIALQRADQAAARLSFEQAIAAGQNDVLTWQLLAELYLAESRPDDAQRILTALTQLYPDYNPAWDKLINFYRDSNRNPLARQAAKRWLDAAPYSGQAHARAGYIAFEDPDQGTDTALEHLRNAITLAPDDVAVRNIAREVYRAAQREDEFFDLLSAQIARTPRAFLLTSLLVDRLLTQERAAEVPPIIERARLASQDNARLLYSFSGLAARANLKNTELAILRQAIAADPTLPSAANNFAFRTTEVPDVTPAQLAQAERIMLQITSLDPLPSHLDTLGWVYYQQGRFPLAVETIERAISLAAGAPVPIQLDHLGDARWLAGNATGAVRAWQAALNTLNTDNNAPDSSSATSPPTTRPAAQSLLLNQLTQKIAAAQRGTPPPVAPSASTTHRGTTPPKDPR